MNDPLCSRPHGCSTPDICVKDKPACGTQKTLLWRLRELESTQCFVLETPALVLKDGCEHDVLDDNRERWKYPEPAPSDTYIVVWTAVAVGSEENLDCIANALNLAQFRMF